MHEIKSKPSIFSSATTCSNLLGSLALGGRRHSFLGGEIPGCCTKETFDGSNERGEIKLTFRIRGTNSKVATCDVEIKICQKDL